MSGSIKITKNSYERIFEIYSSRTTKIDKESKKFLKIFIKLLKGKKVLNIGSASGIESKYLHDSGLKVIGIDISENFTKSASATFKDCKFLQMDMRKLTFPDNSFNGLWVNSSFLHIPKKYSKSTLRGFWRVLKKNGILFINVMEGRYDGTRKNKELNWPERHFSDYKKEEFENLIRKSNFSIVKERIIKTSWGKTFLNYFLEK